MTWWHYLLLVNIYLLLFYGFYALLLRNETFFQLNRVYLVGGALLSFLIPVIQADWIKQLFITRQVQQTLYATINPGVIYQVSHNDSHPITFGQIFAVVYIAGTVILLGRFFIQLMAVKKLIARVGSSAAFSFFNKVKVDEDLPGLQTIIEHEQVHVSQWHSADILFIEAVMIVNWFNPVVYFYRKAIKHVHEFIADKKAIEKGTSKTEYAYLLLSQTFGTVPHQLTNNFFNHSLLKQRILMLNKDESKRRVLLKYGLSAPLFAAMLILSSATVKNSRMIRVINKKTEQVFLMHAMPAKPQPENLTVVPEKIAQRSPTDTQLASEETTTDTPPPPTVTEDGSSIFTSVEVSPEFPGGEPAFGRFLQARLCYPQQAKDHNIQGRVYIQFVVEKDGSLDNMKVLREPGNGLGEEAMRVLATSPKWSPGIQNGRPVKVQYTVPVNFSLSTDGPMPAHDTLIRKVMGFATQVRVSGGTSDPIMMVRRDSLPRHTVQSVMYFRHDALDTTKATYMVNGKEISPQEFSRIAPTMIKDVRVYKAVGPMTSDEKSKKANISITLKDPKQDR